MCCKEQAQDVRGGGENSLLVKVSESHIRGNTLYMRDYRKVE